VSVLSSAFTEEPPSHRDRRGRLIRDGVAHAADTLPSPPAAIVEPIKSFGAFVHRRNPSLLRYEHVPRLVSVLDRLATGELRRVIVIEPPRYFKTELCSRLLAPYFLRQHPTEPVGLASYGAELAWAISEEARNNFQADGGILRADTSAKKRWRTSEGGEMWAAGVGGPMLGFGYRLGIVDDPTDPEKAHSPTYQKRFEDWWPSKWLSRQEPEARILIVMQRLGADDPIDFLFRRELGEDTDEAPEHWHVVFCDEVKSNDPIGRWDGPMGLPPTCTLEPDARKPGEVLAPSRFTPQQVKQLQIAAGAYANAAQRQGRPSPPTGDFWKEIWFEPYDDLPRDAYNGGWDWDTAYTKDDANSASAGVQSYRGRSPPDSRGKAQHDLFPIYIHDVDWDWLEYPELVSLIKGKSGPHYVEDKATGKSAKQSLERERIAVETVSVVGDKLARASNVQPVVNNRRVFVRRAIFRKLLHGERQGLLRVRAETLVAGGPDLDVNDAFVQALTRHVNDALTSHDFGTWKRTG
jgi:hypothetical protein